MVLTPHGWRPCWRQDFKGLPTYLCIRDVPRLYRVVGCMSSISLIGQDGRDGGASSHRDGDLEMASLGSWRAASQIFDRPTEKELQERSSHRGGGIRLKIPRAWAIVTCQIQPPLASPICRRTLHVARRASPGPPMAKMGNPCRRCRDGDGGVKGGSRRGAVDVVGTYGS